MTKRRSLNAPQAAFASWWQHVDGSRTPALIVLVSLPMKASDRSSLEVCGLS